MPFDKSRYRGVRNGHKWGKWPLFHLEGLRESYLRFLYRKGAGIDVWKIVPWLVMSSRWVICLFLGARMLPCSPCLRNAKREGCHVLFATCSRHCISGGRPSLWVHGLGWLLNFGEDIGDKPDAGEGFHSLHRCWPLTMHYQLFSFLRPHFVLFRTLLWVGKSVLPFPFLLHARLTWLCLVVAPPWPLGMLVPETRQAVAKGGRALKVPWQS